MIASAARCVPRRGGTAEVGEEGAMKSRRGHGALVIALIVAIAFFVGSVPSVHARALVFGFGYSFWYPYPYAYPYAFGPYAYGYPYAYPYPVYSSPIVVEQAPVYVKP